MPAFLPLTCLSLYIALVCLHFFMCRFTPTTPKTKFHFILPSMKSTMNIIFFMVGWIFISSLVQIPSDCIMITSILRVISRNKWDKLFNGPKKLWKTTFKKFERIWSALGRPYPFKFLKTPFYKFYLVHSWNETEKFWKQWTVFWRYGMVWYPYRW